MVAAVHYKQHGHFYNFPVAVALPALLPQPLPSFNRSTSFICWLDIDRAVIAYCKIAVSVLDRTPLLPLLNPLGTYDFGSASRTTVRRAVRYLGGFNSVDDAYLSSQEEFEIYKLRSVRTTITAYAKKLYVFPPPPSPNPQQLIDFFQSGITEITLPRPLPFYRLHAPAVDDLHGHVARQMVDMLSPATLELYSNPTQSLSVGRTKLRKASIDL